MMNEPIPIQRDPEPVTDEFRLRKQAHEHRLQWAFLAVLGVVVLGFLTPLIVWLTRLALGG